MGVLTKVDRPEGGRSLRDKFGWWVDTSSGLHRGARVVRSRVIFGVPYTSSLGRK